MRTDLWALLLAFAAVAASPAQARTILGTEPALGQLRPGEKVLVDDGSCPAGQIRELTGAYPGNERGVRGPDGVSRISACIKRPR